MPEENAAVSAVTNTATQVTFKTADFAVNVIGKTAKQLSLILFALMKTGAGKVSGQSKVKGKVNTKTLQSIGQTEAVLVKSKDIGRIAKRLKDFGVKYNYITIPNDKEHRYIQFNSSNAANVNAVLKELNIDILDKASIDIKEEKQKEQVSKEISEEKVSTKEEQPNLTPEQEETEFLQSEFELQNFIQGNNLNPVSKAESNEQKIIASLKDDIEDRPSLRGKVAMIKNKQEIAEKAEQVLAKSKDGIKEAASKVKEVFEK